MVDRRKAADLGINAATVGATVRMLVEGDKVATYKGEGRRGGHPRPIRKEDREKLDQVLKLQVPTGRGFVPLRQIAKIDLSTGPTQIGRVNRQYSVVVGASAFGRVQSDVVADATKIIKGLPLPCGAAYSFTGEQEMQEEAFKNLLIAMLLAVVFIYMVLASQFGSFIQPLVIMLALPLAIIGGLLALLIFQLPLDMTAMIGLILLMGLVTKNSILLVDLTNRLRRERGMGRRSCAQDRRPRPPAAHPDDHPGADPGHVAGGDRPRLRRRLPAQHGRHGHRRADHIDDPDAADRAHGVQPGRRSAGTHSGESGGAPGSRRGGGRGCEGEGDGRRRRSVGF